jgi:hypothetical protein
VPACQASSAADLVVLASAPHRNTVTAAAPDYLPEAMRRHCDEVPAMRAVGEADTWTGICGYAPGMRRRGGRGCGASARAARARRTYDRIMEDSP